MWPNGCDFSNVKRLGCHEPYVILHLQWPHERSKCVCIFWLGNNVRNSVFFSFVCVMSGKLLQLKANISNSHGMVSIVFSIWWIRSSGSNVSYLVRSKDDLLCRTHQKPTFIFAQSRKKASIFVIEKSAWELMEKEKTEIRIKSLGGNVDFGYIPNIFSRNAVFFLAYHRPIF